MLLSIGMVGQAVRTLQANLNLLPTLLARLKDDGHFGPLTRARVQEFQGKNALAADGIAGPLTQGVIDALLTALGGSKPGTASGAVRPINQEILGQPGTDNLVLQALPSIGFIVASTYRRNDSANLPMFMSTPPMVARIGIFAARNGAQERGVILALPALGFVNRVIVCVTQSFQQASPWLDPLGWSNPLSKPFIEYVLLKHVVNRFAPQILASRLDTALVYLVRAKGDPELGPFATDGAFLKQVLGDLSALTNGAFAYRHFETFTFSSGILDFNKFLRGLGNQFDIAKVYSLDPSGAITAAAPTGTPMRQFVTGATMRSSNPPAGFEYMPLARWAKEFQFNAYSKGNARVVNDYLHNTCAPNYFLYLGLNT